MAVRSQVRGQQARPPATVTPPPKRAVVLVFLGLLPLLVMGAVAVVDILAGPRFGFLPLLSLGPALAAVSLRPMRTAMVGGLAMTLCLLLAWFDGLMFSQRGATALTTIAGISAAGAVASAARSRRERELADVSTVAEAAQRILLRPVSDEIGPVQIAARYVSASASARIGGDLYEVIMAQEAIRLIIADVQGKGLAAARTAAAVLGAFREAAYDALDLAEIAARIEISLERQAAEDEFVTAVLAQVAADGSSVEILNCGHPPPALISGGAAIVADPPEPGLPLGLAQLAVFVRETSIIDLAPAARLLFYTDGISEARDRSGTFYPLDSCGVLLAGEDPDDALHRLSDDVARHVGHQLHDDAAMLLVSRRPDDDPVGNGQQGALTGRAFLPSVSPVRRRPVG